MIFFDTNVLIYYTINQDEEKQKNSQKHIEEAIKNGLFFISPLVMTEYIFILSKLKIEKENQNKIEFFSQYIQSVISEKEIMEDYSICQKIDFCRNINDAIHLVVAQKHCHTLLTFDSDFKKVKALSSIDIIVL